MCADGEKTFIWDEWEQLLVLKKINWCSQVKSKDFTLSQATHPKQKSYFFQIQNSIDPALNCNVKQVEMSVECIEHITTTALFPWQVENITIECATITILAVK